MISWLRHHIGVSAAVTFIGTVISVIGGVLRGPAIVIVVGGLIAAVGALLAESDRRQFQREQSEKSNEIARLNEEIKHSLTGGDSWCWILCGFAEKSPGKGELSISHEGKYPLYDLVVSIRDLTATNRAIEAGETDLDRYQTTLSVGNLKPNFSYPLCQWEFPTADEQDYIFDLHARNGLFRQDYKFRRVKDKRLVGTGGYAVATRVYKVEDSGNVVVLKKEVSQSFPRNQQGEVEW